MHNADARLELLHNLSMIMLQACSAAPYSCIVSVLYGFDKRDHDDKQDFGLEFLRPSQALITVSWLWF